MKPAARRVMRRMVPPVLSDSTEMMPWVCVSLMPSSFLRGPSFSRLNVGVVEVDGNEE
jgi:hypothetical protein